MLKKQKEPSRCIKCCSSNIFKMIKETPKIIVLKDEDYFIESYENKEIIYGCENCGKRFKE